MSIDPRPDLREDSPAWRDLLTKAWPNQALYGALDGFRCYGARLEPLQAGGARLWPGAMPPAEYAEWREKWLVPQGVELRRLLREVRF